MKCQTFISHVLVWEFCVGILPRERLCGQSSEAPWRMSGDKENEVDADVMSLLREYSLEDLAGLLATKGVQKMQDLQCMTDSEMLTAKILGADWGLGFC